MNSTAERSTSEPWHARSPEELSHALDVDLAHGLPAVEASRRLADKGRNAITAERKEPWWEEALESLTEPLQLLLIAVAAVYFWLGETEDAITILGVILTVAGIEVFSELRAKRAVASLAALASPHAVVVRDGQPTGLPACDVVIGDVVLLSPGARVPADVRLLDSVALRIDESGLTGESSPVAKDASANVAPAAELADRLTMAYAGTLITAGKGRGVVTATAMQTELGRIAGMVRQAKEPRTPLQLALGQLSRCCSGRPLASACWCRCWGCSSPAGRSGKWSWWASRWRSPPSPRNCRSLSPWCWGWARIGWPSGTPSCVA